MGKPVLHTPLSNFGHQQSRTERYDLLTHKDEEPYTLRLVVHVVQYNAVFVCGVHSI